MTPAIGGVIVASGDDERVELTVFGAVLTPDTEIEIKEWFGDNCAHTRIRLGEQDRIELIELLGGRP